MITWHPYTITDGEWAEVDQLILTAWDTGAWSVHDPVRGRGTKHSEFTPILAKPEDRNIEAAKRYAEQGAYDLNNEDPF